LMSSGSETGATFTVKNSSGVTVFSGPIDPIWFWAAPISMSAHSISIASQSAPTQLLWRSACVSSPMFESTHQQICTPHSSTPCAVTKRSVTGQTLLAALAYGAAHLND
jgi:hypothetical protein